MFPDRSIPTYSLFGQEVGLVEPGFFHVERLSDRLHFHGQFVEDHSHPHLSQMTLWIAGGGTYRADEATSQVAPGLFCWMPAGVVHGFEVDPDAEAIVLSMSEDFVRVHLGEVMGIATAGILPGKQLLSLGDDSYSWLRDLFERMEHEYAKARFAQLESVGALARLVLAETMRVDQARERARALSPGIEASLVARFLSCVEEHLGQRPTVATLARDLGSTPYLLNRACRNALDMCASEVVRARHIQEAKRLLLFTALSINQIGGRVGYADTAHFVRAFRGVTGQTPRSWRNDRIDMETRLSPD